MFEINLHKIPEPFKFLTKKDGVEFKVKYFRVSEVPKFIPINKGNHLYLLIKKINKNTLDIIQDISETFNLDTKDIGFAGLKDKNAETFQWVSINLDKLKYGIDYLIKNFPVEVIVYRKNNKKLRRGNLIGNHFTIVLEGNVNKIIKILDELNEIEFIPNYFGVQRFGGINHIIGYELLFGSKNKAKKLMRKQKIPLKYHYFKLLEDSYRSYIFNKILSTRLPIYSPLKGDILKGNIPTGLVPGFDELYADGFQGDIEREFSNKIENRRIKSSRRSLFVKHKLKYTILGENLIELKFTLPKGSYATSLLREISKNKNIIWIFPSSSF